MEAVSKARYLRITPRKADSVLKLIRGMQVDQAQDLLAFTPKPIAKQINKVLKSAVANATKKEEKLKSESLFVKTAVAGAGPIYKRFLPRAHGRATRFWKRTSHITIVVSDVRKKK